jgi:hypothetical protein
MNSSNIAKLKQEPAPIVIYKTDTAVVITNNEEIISAIKELGYTGARTLRSLQEEKSKADQSERFIKWVSNDIIFSVSATLLVFTLGIIFDRIYKWAEKGKRKKELKKYFISQVSKITNSIAAPLMNAYDIVSKNTTINSGIRSTPPKVLSGEIKRVNEVNTNELYLAIKEHDALSVILSQIDLIEQLQNEVERFHFLIRDRSQVLRLEIQKLNELYFCSLRETYSHIRNSEQNESTEQQLEYLNKVFIKHDEEMKGKRALSEFYNEIVRPLQEKIVREKLHIDPNWNKVVEFGKAFSHKYNELADINNEFKDQYEVFHNHLSMAVDKITANLPKLESSNKK